MRHEIRKEISNKRSCFQLTASYSALHKCIPYVCVTCMRPFDADLRRRILEVPEEVSSTIVAARFNVSASFVRKYRQRVRLGGDIEPTSIPGRPPKIDKNGEKVLATLVKKHADSTLQELSELYQAARDVSVDPSTICRHLKTMGITLKKSR